MCLLSRIHEHQRLSMSGTGCADPRVSLLLAVSHCQMCARKAHIFVLLGRIPRDARSWAACSLCMSLPSLRAAAVLDKFFPGRSGLLPMGGSVVPAKQSGAGISMRHLSFCASPLFTGGPGTGTLKGLQGSPWRPSRLGPLHRMSNGS